MTMVGSFGQWGSSEHHRRYSEKVAAKSRRRCGCGCKRRATHRGVANGVTLITGCELSIRPCIRDGAWHVERTTPDRAGLVLVEAARCFCCCHSDPHTALQDHAGTVGKGRGGCSKNGLLVAGPN